MTLSAVATRYAKALADVTTSAAGLQPDAALGQLRAFESALNGSQELQNALTTPAVPAMAWRLVPPAFLRSDNTTPMLVMARHARSPAHSAGEICTWRRRVADREMPPVQGGQLLSDRGQARPSGAAEDPPPSAPFWPARAVQKQTSVRLSPCARFLLRRSIRNPIQGSPSTKLGTTRARIEAEIGFVFLGLAQTSDSPSRDKTRGA